MNITPTSTWAIKSLVQILKINAEDVSVISGTKKPVTIPILPANPKSETQEPVNNKTRKRKAENKDEPKAKKVAPNGLKKKKNKKKKAVSADEDPESSGFHDLEDVETWVCAICQCYDPIITSPLKGNQMLMTTEWIGCDCNRWYHKYCTRLKHIDDSFSCKQLNRECLPL